MFRKIDKGRRERRTESFLDMLPAAAANWFSREAGALVLVLADLEREDAWQVGKEPPASAKQPQPTTDTFQGDAAFSFVLLFTSLFLLGNFVHLPLYNEKTSSTPGRPSDCMRTDPTSVNLAAHMKM